MHIRRGNRRRTGRRHRHQWSRPHGSGRIRREHDEQQALQVLSRGGYKSTRTGEIDFVVTTVRDRKGNLVSASGTLSGHNNVQGQALGINMAFTQPYANGNGAGYTLTGKVVLQSCIAKKLPVCGPSGTITFTNRVVKYGPQTPATAKSSNPKLWPVFSTP
ncbi:hypothetical protein ACFQ3Z_10555 [Streptomyces nogalater]